MKITLHDVAARADVSIATVSRALNGLPVSKASKAQVERAVAELGYVANEAARALRSERTMTIGLIFNDLRNVLGIDLLDALSESVEDAGYSLLIATARGDASRYDLLMRRFLERRVDALFCIRPRGDGAFLNHCKTANVPVLAMFGAAGGFAGVPCITPTLSGACRALSNALAENGHQRVAVLRGAATSAPMAAIAEALKAASLRVTVREVSEMGGAGEAFDALLARKQRPSVVVAPDPLVRALPSACKGAGLRVPEDLSIVSVCEVSAEAHHRRHDLAAITIDPQRMGRAAGGAMVAWLSGVRPAERVRIEAAEFVPRGSFGAAPGTARI